MQRYSRVLTIVFVLMLIMAVSITGAQDDNILRMNMGESDVPTLDPSLGTDTSSIALITELFPSMARLHEISAVVEPGLASSWDVSEDGLTYTFHILEDVSWVRYNAESGEVEQVMDADGNVRFVTAQDFQYGIMRSMDPRTGSYYGGIMASWIAGGSELNLSLDEVAEDAPDEEIAAIVDEAMAGVQVNVIDDATLEITLSQQAAFVINILGMWQAAAQPSWLQEEYGDLWIEAEYIQSYGPFVLSEWEHGESITMIRNPFWAGTDSIPVPMLDGVNWVFLASDAGFANYEAGLLDVESVPGSEMARVQADPVLGSQLTITPRDCTYYYGYNTTVAPFDDARVRRAFSMAVNRQELIDNVLQGGQVPAYFFSRQDMLVGSPRAEDYPDMAIQEDDDAARALIEEYLAENGDMPAIILMHNESQGHANIAAAIQEMWRDTFDGLIDADNIQVQTQEWGVYLETVSSADTAPGVWRLGWCSDYPDAHNFLFDVFHSSVSHYGTGWVSEEYEGLLEQAMVETDTAVREELYAQAEYILTNQDAVIIPIYFYTRVSMTQPYVERTFNLSAPARYEKWSLNR